MNPLREWFSYWLFEKRLKVRCTSASRTSAQKIFPPLLISHCAVSEILLRVYLAQFLLGPFAELNRQLKVVCILNLLSGQDLFLLVLS
jgi:hypothetical protein